MRVKQCGIHSSVTEIGRQGLCKSVQVSNLWYRFQIFDFDAYERKNHDQVEQGEGKKAYNKQASNSLARRIHFTASNISLSLSMMIFLSVFNQY